MACSRSFSSSSAWRGLYLGRTVDLRDRRNSRRLDGVSAAPFQGAGLHFGTGTSQAGVFNGGGAPDVQRGDAPGGRLPEAGHMSDTMTSILAAGLRGPGQASGAVGDHRHHGSFQPRRERSGQLAPSPHQRVRRQPSPPRHRLHRHLPEHGFTRYSIEETLSNAPDTPVLAAQGSLHGCLNFSASTDEVARCRPRGWAAASRTRRTTRRTRLSGS